MATAYEIAAFRFEMIAPFLDETLSPAEQEAAMRDRTATPVEWPQSKSARKRGKPPKVEPISRACLYLWIQAFQTYGYQGLLPKVRKDRGKIRTGKADWIAYAIGLLYEQEERSLYQLELYLRIEFPSYSLSRSTLSRRLRQHPAYAGIVRLRKRAEAQRRLRDLYETQRPHQSWQLDGKGPFEVTLVDGTRHSVHVLSIIDDYSRAILAAVVAPSESLAAATRVTKKAVAIYGLPDRFQFDLGTGFEAKSFRASLAQHGVHRNPAEGGNAERQGKIEAYHRVLKRWFIKELRAQEVVSLDHLQELLEAYLELVYNRHWHSEIKATPKERLAGRKSARMISMQDFARAFWLEVDKSSHAKTGELKLPGGVFRVPRPFAGTRRRFLYDPADPYAVLVLDDDREIVLEPFARVQAFANDEKRETPATGQLQKLLDLWRGHTRPNAQPGFGLPEVFRLIGRLVGRTVPEDEREALLITAFYRRRGPLPRKPFERAVERTLHELGAGRPLTTYLDDLERQIEADPHDTDQGAQSQ